MRGFTLLETLVAVTILTLAVAGPLTSASRAVIAAQTASQQLTASYLAQEGIEYVRLMRDDESLAFYSGGGPASAWTDFITGSSASSITGCRSSACTLDPLSSMGTGSGHSLSPCSGNSCGSLYLRPDGIYTEQSGAAGAVKTPYTRTLQAVDISASDERITSKVQWVSRGTTYTVSVTDHLTPWE
ncbi:type II secretion system protein [Candidatus Kaiserbacteria bacterium]|nr:type II secretion system protein [Candidatus Kaiserbacteria bacterium]